MIRKFLKREGQFLLQELGAPDWRTLWLRAATYAIVWTATLAIGLGLVWLYRVAGTEAMWIAVVAIMLLAIWMERRMPVYYSSDMWWLGEQLPALPRPGKPALPPPRPGQLGRPQPRRY